MDYRIRSAVAADAPMLPEIERSAGVIFGSVAGLEWIAHDAVSSLSSLLEMIADGTTWVAEDADANLVGYLGAEPVADALHIWEVAVHTDHQRRGIGARLMAAAEAAAPAVGCTSLTLTTFRGVAWNEPYYANLGYTVIDGDRRGMWLSSVLADEGARGLPVERRCAMRKVILPLALPVIDR